MRHLILIAHNIRSCHNVGSLLRTAEGLGVEKVYLTGYTPYPIAPHDERLPHIRNKIDRQIHKTALGAESQIIWQHVASIENVFAELHTQGFRICALEQTEQSLDITTYRPNEKIALLVGHEVEGVEPEVLERTDDTLEIPMFGQKESFNVVQAAAMALFYLRFA